MHTQKHSEEKVKFMKSRPRSRLGRDGENMYYVYVLESEEDGRLYIGSLLSKTKELF